jgi:hypothetical protein
VERLRERIRRDRPFGSRNWTIATAQRLPGPESGAALDELMSYLAAHTERLNYCHRLYTGQSIGSGMVEGAAKNPIGRRLKHNGAR